MRYAQYPLKSSHCPFKLGFLNGDAMAIGSLNIGVPKRLTATANVKVGQGAILGIWVSAASAVPTITVYDDAGTGTTNTMMGVFTPTPSMWYPMPAGFSAGLYVVISGTVDCTVVYD